MSQGTPGWYRAPNNENVWQYFDGNTWTQNYSAVNENTILKQKPSTKNGYLKIFLIPVIIILVSCVGLLGLRTANSFSKRNTGPALATLVTQWKMPTTPTNVTSETTPARGSWCSVSQCYPERLTVVYTVPKGAYYSEVEYAQKFMSMNSLTGDCVAYQTDGVHMSLNVPAQANNNNLVWPVAIVVKQKNSGYIVSVSGDSETPAVTVGLPQGPSPTCVILNF